MSQFIKVFEDIKAELRGWEIKSVADVSGVSKFTIYCWLEGRTKKPRLDTITKVAQAIGFELQLVRRKVELRLVK